MAGIIWGNGSSTGQYAAMHHLLLNRNFESQMILSDPLLNMIYGKIVKRKIAGQTDILKLNLDNSFHLMATGADNYAFDVAPGAPRIVDETIKNRTLTGRFQVSGKMIKQLRAATPQSEAYNLAMMKTDFLNMVKSSLTRCMASDGTGWLAYCNNNTNNTSGVLKLYERDGATYLHPGHPSWRRLQVGSSIDVCTVADGLILTGGGDKVITAVTRPVKQGDVASITVATMGTMSGTAGKTWFVRLYTPLSDSTNADYIDSAYALQPEPNGFDGIFNSALTYLGVTKATYPTWRCPVVDAGGLSPDIAMIDEAVCQIEEPIGRLVCVGDASVLSQLRKEAEGKKMIINDTDPVNLLGVKEVRFQSLLTSFQQPIPILTSPEFLGSKKLFFIDTGALEIKGTLPDVTWVRGTLVCSEAQDRYFDDMELEYEMYATRLNSSFVIQNCGASFGWNKIVA